jgi:hypothetical protein
MELSDQEIGRFFAGLPQYGGCISRDQTRYVKRNSRQFYVLNLDRADGRGTHWTLLSFMDPHIGIYADSFGEPPPESVERLMKKLRPKNVFSMKDIQSLDSVLCGYFAAYIACQLLNGKRFADIINSFSDKTSENEKMMLAFATQAFRWKFKPNRLR